MAWRHFNDMAPSAKFLNKNDTFQWDMTLLLEGVCCWLLLEGVC